MQAFPSPAAAEDASADDAGTGAVQRSGRRVTRGSLQQQASPILEAVRSGEQLFGAELAADDDASKGRRVTPPRSARKSAAAIAVIEEEPEELEEQQQQAALQEEAAAVAPADVAHDEIAVHAEAAAAADADSDEEDGVNADMQQAEAAEEPAALEQQEAEQSEGEEDETAAAAAVGTEYEDAQDEEQVDDDDGEDAAAAEAAADDEAAAAAPQASGGAAAAAAPAPTGNSADALSAWLAATAAAQAGAGDKAKQQLEAVKDKAPAPRSNLVSSIRSFVPTVAKEAAPPAAGKVKVKVRPAMQGDEIITTFCAGPGASTLSTAVLSRGVKACLSEAAAMGCSIVIGARICCAFGFFHCRILRLTAVG
jgi:SWI/SNF-related matrix-associated actin-dependent regulator 1 of chromatin subfamily A